MGHKSDPDSDVRSQDLGSRCEAELLCVIVSWGKREGEKRAAKGGRWDGQSVGIMTVTFGWFSCRSAKLHGEECRCSVQNSHPPQHVGNNADRSLVKGTVKPEHHRHAPSFCTSQPPFWLDVFQVALQTHHELCLQERVVLAP